MRGTEAAIGGGLDGYRSAVPAGAHGIHPTVHRLQARSEAGDLQAPGAGAHPVHHIRVHRLSGAGHADIPAAGGLLPGAGRHGAAGHEQEEGQGYRQGEGGLPPRGPVAADRRVRGQRHPGGRRPGHL